MINSIQETLKIRTKSAFGGTLIFVWLFINWRLIYMIFNFDDDYLLGNKIYEIRRYIDSNKEDIFIRPIWITLLSILLFNLFNQASLIIINVFDIWIKPFFLRKIDSNRIIVRERYEILEKKLIEINKQYESEKKIYIESNQTVDSLSKEIVDLNLYKNTIEIKLQDISARNHSLEQDILNINISKEETFAKLNSIIQAKDVRIETQLVEIQSLKSKSNISNQAEIIFEGIWIKTFQIENSEKTGSEQFNISENTYFINNIKHFEILSLTSFDNKYFEMKKRRLDNGNILLNRFIKINDSYFIGIENDKTKIEYKRL